MARLVGCAGTQTGTADAAPLRVAPRYPIDHLKLPIVAIGASTGGPQALAKVLKHLPS